VQEFVSKLWELDINRFEPGRDYALNLGHGKKPWQVHDAAGDLLFKFVNKDKFFNTPTYRAMYSLLDNYERGCDEEEVVTREEKKENWQFLDAVLDTPCGAYMHKYLVAKGLADVNERDFKRDLYQMWFALYRRDGELSSSGFEHVFIGEESRGKITGLHSWIQTFILERKGELNYKGYILPRRKHRSAEDDADEDDHVLTVQFDWGEESKSVSTMFLGVSPEFELSLYTALFLLGKEEGKESYELDIEDKDVRVRLYRIKSKYGDKVGSAFPELME